MDRDSLPTRAKPTDGPASESVGKAASSRSASQSFTDLARRCELLGVVDSFTPSIEEQLAALDRAKKSDRSKQTRKENLRQCH